MARIQLSAARSVPADGRERRRQVRGGSPAYGGSGRPAQHDSDGWALLAATPTEGVRPHPLHGAELGSSRTEGGIKDASAEQILPRDRRDS
jgi:hypothetical protein